MFVLVSYNEHGKDKRYYTGKTYRVNKEVYPVTSDENEKAKQYSSDKIANNACEKLNSKLELWEFCVEESND